MEHIVYLVITGTMAPSKSLAASSLHNIKEVEKAVMNIGLGKKHGQYFIFIVASDAASGFFFNLPCHLKS